MSTVPEDVRAAVAQLLRTHAKCWQPDQKSYVSGNVSTADLAKVIRYVESLIATESGKPCEKWCKRVIALMDLNETCLYPETCPVDGLEPPFPSPSTNSSEKP